MALKHNEDFLRFLTMGAAGTAAVLDALDSDHRHSMIELERYATANKLWATKIKRLRLADLLCVDCGVRVEVRAKSKLAIRMSHSELPGREWDAGLRDEDLAAFVAWDPGSQVISRHHQLFRVGAMRAAVRHARLGPRKAPSEGAERDITWPSSVPKHDGRVISVDATDGSALYEPHTGRRHTYRLKGVSPTYVYASNGQELEGGRQFLLGCVGLPGEIGCPGRTWSFERDLNSDDPIERYVAVKAAGARGKRPDSAVWARLEAIIEDPGEDQRIRIEALSSLAAFDASHVATLHDQARRPTGGETSAKAHAMECIFILSELKSREAIEALAVLAEDTGIDSEARCAAVWGLGITGADESAQVLRHIADPDDDVALHALAGIGELGAAEISELLRMLNQGDDREAASAATLLSKEGEAGVLPLLEVAKKENRAGRWARAALGEIAESDVRELSGRRLTPELEFLLSPAWTAQKSWLSEQGAEGPLDLLRRQRIRHRD
jgi:hypothetical protein